MKVLIIGGGGREHALSLLVSKSESVKQFYCLPGNPGIARESKFVPVSTNIDVTKPENFPFLIDFVIKKKIDLTIVGPDDPLAAGIVNLFQKNGLAIFGPTKEAAKIEWSKWYAKQVMQAAGVKTAFAERFDTSSVDNAFRHPRRRGTPIVIKTDGLALGKGAFVCRNLIETEAAITKCLVDEELGEAGKRILIEDYLEPVSTKFRCEISVFALIDYWGNYILFPAAQDYKTIGDGDTGDNTGGMGAFAPVPWVSNQMMKKIGTTIFEPIIKEMKKRNSNFTGALYAGLMYTIDGFKVVEFNARFGDPEFQPLSMLVNFDIVAVMNRIARGGSIADMVLNINENGWKMNSSACTVVMASPGYPKSYPKDIEIIIDHEWLDSFMGDSVKVFHAGTALKGNCLVTSGGRVLSVTGFTTNGVDPKRAANYAYISIAHIDFKRACFRRDIGMNVPINIYH